MNRDLSRLLRPKTIAVIGGGTWCENVIEQCLKIGFSGQIWPVHPKRDSVGGLAAFDSVDALPSPPDACFVGVNRNATIEVISDLNSQGAGGAICFASGYQEALGELSDGADLQAGLLQAAGDMPIIGPNCYGLLNYLDGSALWPDQHGGVRVESGVGVITQSSNIAINLTMQQRGLPMAYVVTAGNQAQTGISEIGKALLSDDRVTALGLHIEGIGDLAAFEDLTAFARNRGKPIVALKVGRSEHAQAATVSHTASLAGSDTGAGALFRRLGVGQVHTLAGFLETLKILHFVGPLASNRIASMSCSGGEASLIADSVLDLDLSFPPLNETQKSKMRQALGPKVALANPLDYHTYIWGDEQAMTDTFAAMMAGDLAIGLIMLDFPRGDRCSAEEWKPVISAAARAQAISGKPLAIVSSLAETLPEEIAEEVIAAGILPLAGLTEALEALEAAATIGKLQAQTAPLLIPSKPTTKSKTLTESQSKHELAAFGMNVPKSFQATTPEQAAELAEQIGFPVALKGEGIAHKTEAGAVALGLESASEVADAARAMSAENFLVEQMIVGPSVEMLVGIVCDPAHGYVLTLAAGGTLTELMDDSVSLLVPAGAQDIENAMLGLKSAKLLNGYRGAPPANRQALIDAVTQLQDYVQSARPLEVEVNPLMCGPEHAVVADALITLGVPDD